ncbi:Ba197 [Baboon cytomegalovirus]|nr:Ba197 [Baboon cytomegalovirus]
MIATPHVPLWLRRRILVWSVYAWTCFGIAVTVFVYGAVRMIEPICSSGPCVLYPARQMVVLSPILILVRESYEQDDDQHDSIAATRNLGFLLYIIHLALSYALFGVCIHPVNTVYSCAVITVLLLPSVFIRWHARGLQYYKAAFDISSIVCLTINLVLRNVLGQSQVLIPMLVFHVLSMISFVGAFTITLSEVERYMTVARIKRTAIVLYCHLNLMHYSILYMWYSPW